MSYLVLVRHGKSEWNNKGLWTGLTDIELHPDGVQDAKNMAALIKGLPIDKVYTSKLIRAKETADVICSELNINPPRIENEALNERDYGIYTGKNKWEIKSQVGEEKFKQMRRGWNVALENGETLKDVYERVLPYFKEVILQDLKNGQNILISAHGNSLRSLVKYLNNLSEEEISSLEFGIGEVYVYKIDENGNVLSYEIRGENPNKGKI